MWCLVFWVQTYFSDQHSVYELIQQIENPLAEIPLLVIIEMCLSVPQSTRIAFSDSFFYIINLLWKNSVGNNVFEFKLFYWLHLPCLHIALHPHIMKMRISSLDMAKSVFRGGTQDFCIA